MTHSPFAHLADVVTECMITVWRAGAAAADEPPAGAAGAAAEAPSTAGPAAAAGPWFKAEDEAPGPGAARGAGAGHEHPAGTAQAGNR